MLRKLFVQYNGLILYGIFGVLTTVVNIVSYYLLAHLLRVPVVISTALAWCVSVLFAYFTNRKWVFHSTADGRRAVLKEMAAFFACRLGTGVLDLGIMYVFADQLQFHDVAVKAVSNILVIVLNYVFSKVLIFRH
ncbi:MAG: GtrA family protein [Lachnospiraceae bacterium]|nr:GtrA family protein [Lachnospiraceae bacterium]